MNLDITIAGVAEALKRINAFDNIPDGILGVVFSGGAYGPSGRYEHYVQSARYQAAIHHGRWMTDADIAAKNEKEIRQEFVRLVEAIAAGGRVNVRAATERALKMLYDDFRVYPPPPSGSRYIRTGTLKASYRYEVKV